MFHENEELRLYISLTDPGKPCHSALAKRAKAANLDAIHDTVDEMARDEARHGKAFEGLLKRYLG